MATTTTRSPAQPAAPAPRQTSPVTPRRSSSSSGPSGGAPFVRLATLRPASGSGPPAVREVIERDKGEPLSLPVRGALEQSLGVDLAPVRVHASANAASVVENMRARAFAFGTHIFLGKKERGNDLALLAHEVAHVVQQQGGAVVQRKGGPDAGSGLEREADHVSSAIVSGQPAIVTGRTDARPQFSFGDWVRSGVSAIGRGVSAVAGAVGDIVGAALNFIRDHAQNIPGYNMLAFILGRDPITQQPVERNAVNLIRAIMSLWPAGNLVFEALQRYGIIDRVGSWLEQQLNTLGMAASAIRQALDRFIGTLGASDILNLGAVWDRARRIFSEPIDRASQFVRGLVTGVLGFIRDAVLRPIARLAEGTRGYDLLRLVLGQDPITGDPYPRTPENMIGGFMRLIGQEEKWRHLQESRAIPRVWAWFQQQFATLMGFVQQVPGLFVRAWQSLQISDLLDLGGAFSRMRAIFGGFVSNFLSWAGAAALQIMMFIFEALAPGAMPVLRRAQSVIRTIISDPIRFVGNLVRAGLKGFEQFRDNIRTHLINGLVGWLTGALTGAGLQLPARWDLRGILSLVLQILGLTWQNIRTKLVRVMGETAVAVLETTFDILITLVREGPAAAWEKILEQLSNLQEMVFGQIRDWVVRTVVGQAVIRIVSMLNPAGAVIQAIIATYNTIMFFRERLQQIIQVVESFFNSIANIAAGNIGAAADRVEQTMARIIPVVISFLARLIGLGGISDTIRNIIARIRAPIDRALDRVVDWIAAQARRLGRAIMSGARRAAGAVLGFLGIRRQFRTVNGESHTLSFEQRGGQVQLIRSSDLPTEIMTYLNTLDFTGDPRAPRLARAKAIAPQIMLLTRQGPGATTPTQERQVIDLVTELSTLLMDLVNVSLANLPAAADWTQRVKTPASAQHSKVFQLSSLSARGGAAASGSTPEYEYTVRAGWVRMHLLPYSLGGTGEAANWIPAPSNVNSGGPVRSFEEAIVRAVRSAAIPAGGGMRPRPAGPTQPNVVWAEAVVPGWLTPITDKQNRTLNFPSGVDLSFGLYRPEGTAWVKLNEPLGRQSVRIASVPDTKIRLGSSSGTAMRASGLPHLSNAVYGDRLVDLIKDVRGAGFGSYDIVRNRLLAATANSRLFTPALITQIANDFRAHDDILL